MPSLCSRARRDGAGESWAVFSGAKRKSSGHGHGLEHWPKASCLSHHPTRRRRQRGTPSALTHAVSVSLFASHHSAVNKSLICREK